jgi:hypothetical protein
MAARVKGFGKYDYKVLQHDDTICSIEYFDKSKGTKESLGISTFTIADAKKAGTKNLDKFPKNMLFARAMSNGVKWYVPDIYETPVYVPEEMEHLQSTTEAVVIEDYTNEINEAIEKMTLCNSVDELKALKATLPDYVVNSDNFKIEGTKIYNILKDAETHE